MTSVSRCTTPVCSRASGTTRPARPSTAASRKPTTVTSRRVQPTPQLSKRPALQKARRLPICALDRALASAAGAFGRDRLLQIPAGPHASRLDELGLITLFLITNRDNTAKRLVGKLILAGQ